MKIDGRGPNVQPLTDKTQVEKKHKVEGSKAEGLAKADSVNTNLSNALRSVLEGIEASGLSAGDVHSNVSAKSVARLLDESPVAEVQKQLSAADLLQLADQVATQMKSNPRAAAMAIGDVYPDRVAELLS